MIDLGDTVTLSWPDVPASPTAVTVTITQPDATVAGPFTVAAGYGTGLYTYAYVPTLAGRHAVRWLATGPDGEAFTDAFDVAAADPGFVISLADAKAQLNITSVTSDAELRTWLGATTEVIEFLAGDVVARTWTEVHDGGTPRIATRHTPIITVTSLTESIGALIYTLTLQPVGHAVDPWGYTVDLAAGGIITRRGAASWPQPFTSGIGNVTVTYTAGRASVPYAVQAAARLLMAHLWTTRRGAMPLPALPGGDVSMVPGVGYAIPNRVIELLGGIKRVPGIA